MVLLNSTTFILIGVAYFGCMIITLIVVLSIMSRKDRKKYSLEISELERDKNLIISANILTELNKVEPLINNDEMKRIYGSWQERFQQIKEIDIPKITDDLILIEDLFDRKDYRELKKQIADTEMKIYYLKTKSNFLLEEIREITLSEERNRETITKLKANYRTIISKYNNNKGAYSLITQSIELQFENVDKLFGAFELSMDKNAYQEVPKIVRAIDDIIGNLKMIIDEAPLIINMGQKLIPKKIEEVGNTANKLISEGYNLDYLKLEYNIGETKKKITDIFARLNVLNIEDSTFECKTMVDYFDSILTDFDKERGAKKVFEELSRTILVKTTKLANVNNQLLKKIDDIKYSYDLEDEDLSILEVIRDELLEIREQYDVIIEEHRSKKSSFSHLSKAMELLNLKLIKTEDKLDIALRTLGSLKDDELRARDQLDEIKDILNQAKKLMRGYKLPVIPKKYFIELSEATEAITNMIKELEKIPINIKILNTRVDTARDLTLKVFATTKETIKTAKMAEATIVYGNRYRPINKDVNFGLVKAETSFYKGNFKNALENAINAINIVEPGVHKRLIDEYQNE